jgi:hypothetical protein
MYLDDMWMTQRSKDLAFPLNAALRERFGNRLDRVESDNSVQIVLTSAIVNAHAILSKHSQDVVARKPFRVIIIAR